MNTRKWKTTPKYGAVLLAPDNSHVVEKMVCFNEKNARLQCKQWKRRRPDHIARIMSLLPGDRSPPEVVP